MTKSELHDLVDRLPEGALEGAAALLEKIADGKIDPEQAWFWTSEWQEGEQEADTQLAAGEGTTYESTDAFAANLKESPPAQSE